MTPRPTPPAQALDAHPEPPRVVALNGEVLVSGPGVEAVYTVEAARALSCRLDHAAGLADIQRLTEPSCDDS
ncbi:MAG: hypothetical protein ACK4I0_01165 [Brevundimonas sp.]|uniref:hypothetical protein n=1 Tax=Brevundimonas sp. TaxID=1871086 RepID=UPI00391AAD2B